MKQLLNMLNIMMLIIYLFDIYIGWGRAAADSGRDPPAVTGRPRRHGHPHWTRTQTSFYSGLPGHTETPFTLIYIYMHITTPQISTDVVLFEI